MTSPMPPNPLRLPEILCYQAADCGNLPLSFAGAIYSGIQAAIIHKTTSDPKWSQEIHKIQTVFNIIDVGILLWSAGKLINLIEKGYGISLINRFDWDNPWTTWRMVGFNGGFALCALASGALGLKVISSINQRLARKDAAKDLLPKEDQDKLKNITLKWEAVDYQKFTQLLYFAKMLSSVALAYFSSSNKLSFLASTLFPIYSFCKVAKLDWLKLTRSFDLQFGRVDITYRTLIMQSTPSNDDCVICLNNEPKPDYYFCGKHAYHIDCHLNTIIGASDNFLNLDLSSDDSPITLITHTKNGSVTSRHYKIILQESALPKDPLCNSRPPHSYFEGRVQDYTYGSLSASIEVNTDQPLIATSTMATIQSIYSLAQVILSTMQHYFSDWAPSIFKLQQAMMITDTLALGDTSYRLFKEMEKRYFNEWYPAGESRKQNRWKFYAGAGAAAIGVGGISYLAMRILSPLTLPKTNLNDALKNALPQENLSNITAQWNTPRFQKVIEWLLINRIIASAASAYFLENSKQQLLNGALQIATLFNVSHLPWIEFTRTYVNPLGAVAFKVKDSTSQSQEEAYKRIAEKITVTFNYLFNAENSGCEDALKKMHEYSTNFFQNSFWDRYLMISKTNGVETSRTLHYDIKVHFPNFGHYLSSISGAMWDRYYGSNTVTTFYQS